MTTNRTPGFEERLLNELKQVVVERAPVAQPTRAPVSRRPVAARRFALATGAAALGIVATATVSALVQPGGNPAFAVTAQSDGKVRVEVNDFTDPDGLERKLKTAGIAAEVAYLSPGKTCAQPWYTPTSGRREVVKRQSGSTWESLDFTIDPDALRQGETLVLTVWVVRGDGTSAVRGFGAGVAAGMVGPCQQVDPRVPRQIRSN